MTMQQPRRKIRVNIATQTLELFEGEKLLRAWPCSTSKFGEGFENGSFKTPLGNFRVFKKIGGGAALGEIFKSRVATGKFGRHEDPDDFVQTRILWLEGVDAENANTAERFIYIHGTNHEPEIGTKASHGCVRMRNADVVELYELAEEGMEVAIMLA